jgi:hypothetical protein
MGTVTASGGGIASSSGKKPPGVKVSTVWKPAGVNASTAAVRVFASRLGGSQSAIGLPVS